MLKGYMVRKRLGTPALEQLKKAFAHYLFGLVCLCYVYLVSHLYALLLITFYCSIVFVLSVTFPLCCKVEPKHRPNAKSPAVGGTRAG